MTGDGTACPKISPLYTKNGEYQQNWKAIGRRHFLKVYCALTGAWLTHLKGKHECSPKLRTNEWVVFCIPCMYKHGAFNFVFIMPCTVYAPITWTLLLRHSLLKPECKWENVSIYLLPYALTPSDAPNRFSAELTQHHIESSQWAKLQTEPWARGRISTGVLPLERAYRVYYLYLLLLVGARTC